MPVLRAYCQAHHSSTDALLALEKLFAILENYSSVLFKFFLKHLPSNLRGFIIVLCS